MSGISTTTKLSESFDIWDNEILNEMTLRISDALSRNPKSEIDQHFHDWYQWPGTNMISQVLSRKILNYLQSSFTTPLNRDAIITYKSDLVEKMVEAIDGVIHPRRVNAWSFYPGHHVLALIAHDAAMNFIFDTPVLVISENGKLIYQVLTIKEEHAKHAYSIPSELCRDRPSEPNYRLYAEVIAPTILDYVSVEDELLVRRISDSVRRAIQLNKPLKQND